MYRLLIVDDEEIVREGIEHTIAWRELGFEFAGSFENGADAAAAVEELRPAVVITDICMPFSDGLDLTQFIAEKHPQTKVILLSGFSEFSYAQRAVKLGAYDYVLKPITAAELRELLVRLRRDLDAERRRERELQALEQELSARRASILRSLTEEIIAGRPPGTTAKAADDELREAGLSLPAEPARIVVAALDVGEDAGPPAEPSDRLRRLCSDLGVDSFTDYRGRQVAVVSAETPEQAADDASAVSSRLVRRAPEETGVPVSCGVGPELDAAEGFPAAYRAAVRSLEYRFVAGGGRVLRYEELPAGAREEPAGKTASEWTPELRSRTAGLLEALEACDLKEAEERLEAVLAQVATDFRSLSQARLQVYAVLVRLNDLITESGGTPIAADSLTSLVTLEEVQKQLSATCRFAFELRLARRTTHAGAKAEEAVGYIDHNYASTGLSLQSVCRELGVSPSYFSAIFKAHTGRTFVDYLTEIRIDHAKRLLSTTDLRAYEVAERVGFRDQHYFSAIFKKRTGRSPRAFRREIAGGTGE